MRVLIVDDSAFMRKVIKEMLLSDGSIEVVGVARDGAEGVVKALELKPDVVTMDIEMPRQNGIDALREIMAKCKGNAPAVLMCSSLTVDGSTEALKAMRLGASDFIAKDPSVVGKHDPEFQSQLISKIHAIGGHRRRLNNPKTNERLADSERVEDTSGVAVSNTLCTSAEDWVMTGAIDVVVVGSSTGGPPVLERIFSDLPASIKVPIIVAQHIPELFTKSLTQRLDRQCACGAHLAEHGTNLTNPSIYMSIGGKHMKPTKVAGKNLIARTLDSYEDALYKPSVDLLFQTAAELFGSRVLAVQLTGMGEDGAKGAAAIKKAGGQVIAQNEESCVVYGMPRAVVENGSADAIMSPADINQVLRKVLATGFDEQTGQSVLRKTA